MVGAGGKSRKRASRRDVEGSDGAASVKRARRTKGSGELSTPALVKER